MVRYLRAANVKSGVLDLTDVKLMNFSPTEQQIFALRRGDVLVTEGAGSLNAVGASAMWNDELPGVVCFQNTLVRLRPRGSTDARFLNWWAQHAYGSGAFASIAAGVNIFHLGAERVGELPAAYPSLATQTAIADFLDAETARIDALILSRRRAVELLAERIRASVMERIFGSPGPWTALRRLVEVLPGFAFKSEDFAEPGEETVRLLRGINVAPGAVRWDDTVALPIQRQLPEMERYALVPGDLVLGMDRPVVNGGMRVARVEEGDAPSLLVQRVCRIRTLLRSDIDFIRLALASNAFVEYFSPITTGVSVPHINGEQIQSFRLPAPDPRDRQQIAEGLVAMERQSAAITHASQQQIALLRQKRQALITAAVTGEIDVSTASGRGVPA